MSTLRVDSIRGQTAGTDRYIVQIVGDTLNDVVTTTGTTMSDTGLSVTITPKLRTHKFLIMVNLGVLGTGSSDWIRFRLLRDSTEIGSSTGADTQNTFIQFFPNAATDYIGASNHFIDSPSTTSSITYKLQWAMTGDSNTGYINRRSTANYARTSSNFTVMEIAQ